MSEASDLQEAILTELRHPGSALAARVVVTPVRTHGSLVGYPATFSGRRGGGIPMAPGAGVRQETDQVEVRPELDCHSRLLMAARQAVAEARAINQPRFGTRVGPANVTAVEHVVLTITGQIDWRQRAQSAHDAVPAAVERDTPSNMSDDILNMLSDGSFSATRVSR
jgi:hypothetical protein